MRILVVPLAALALAACAPGPAPAEEKPAMTQAAGTPAPRWPAPTEARRAAAAKGDPAAMYAVARHLGAEGRVAPVAVTTPEGMPLLERAAAAGHPPAKAALGWRLVRDEADGTSADPKARDRGVAMIRAAAEAGDAEGRAYLAYLRWQGLGVERDEQEALRLYEAAAAQHLPEAEFQLAVWYTEGTIVPKDHEKARDLYQRAHEHGDPDALEYGRTRIDAGLFEKLWQWMNAT